MIRSAALRLGDVLTERRETLGARAETVVLTLTEKNGFIPQSERFNKRLATEDTSKYKVVRRGDFAFNPYLLWAGAIAMNDRVDEGIVSPLYPIFSVNDGFDTSYLRHLLLSPPMVVRYDSIAFGSVPRRRRSSVRDFLDLELPAVPPLDEQRRIAAVLDHVDALRAKRRSAIDIAYQAASSVFAELYEDLRVGPTRLSDATDIGSGITKGRKTPQGELIDTPYLTVANVQDGWLDLKTVKTLTVSEAERVRFGLQPNDILLTEGGDPDKLGRGTIWRGQIPEVVIHQNHVFRVRSRDVETWDPEFIALALRSRESRSYFLRSAKQTTGIATINKSQLGKVPLRFPSVGVQREIAAKVAAVETIRGRSEHHLSDLDSLFASLQSRAFSGDLDVSRVVLPSS